MIQRQTLSRLHRTKHRSTRHSHTSSKTTPPTQQPARPARALPSPSWALLEPVLPPFRAYGRMQRRSPLLTQLSSSLTIYFLGDLASQRVSSSSSSSGDSRYEPMRGLRALAIGGIASIPSYRWFLFLGNHFNYGSHAASLAVKVLVSQMLFTPVFGAYFFGMQSLLAGCSLRQAGERVCATVPVSWRNSWSVWPLVTAFSYTWVLPQYRSVFAGVVAIGWQTYLSWLNRRAEDAEGKVGGQAVGLVETPVAKAE